MDVYIRRQWNDYNIAKVKLENIKALEWSKYSGGVVQKSPRPFIHGYVYCTVIEGEIAHSCTHGEGPHRIKVCLVKKDNEPKVWKKILEMVGPEPKRSK